MAVESVVVVDCVVVVVEDVVEEVESSVEVVEEVVGALVLVVASVVDEVGRLVVPAGSDAAGEQRQGGGRSECAAPHESPLVASWRRPQCGQSLRSSPIS